jgi:enoyl-CoA hydratase/carnithine racemase
MSLNLTRNGSGESLESYDRVAVLAQEHLSAFDKPLIAMLRGFCIGAGISIAACCDVRIAAKGTRFAIPAAKLGLGYRASGIFNLINLVGPARTLDMFYMADRFSAERAYSIGLIDHVVADPNLHDFVINYCQGIAEGAPLTLAAAKKTVRELLQNRQEYDRELCESLVRKCFLSADF